MKSRLTPSSVWFVCASTCLFPLACERAKDPQAAGTADRGSEIPPDPKPVPEFIQRFVAIRIPILQFNDAPLEEVLDFVRSRMFELDPEDDPNKKGISMLSVGFAAGDNDAHAGQPRSTRPKTPYSATNKRVDEIFIDLAKLYDIEFHVTIVGVVVTPSGKAPFPNPKAEKREFYFTYKADPAKE